MKIDKLITYLNILKETLKYKESMQTRYNDVSILIDDDFIIKERWGGVEDFAHIVEFPAGDIEKRIKTARDHLRYLKKRANGHRYGD